MFGPDSIRRLAKCAAQDFGQYALTRARIRVRRLRVALGLSQEQLAQLLTEHGCRCSRKTVANYKHPRGTEIPAKVLGVLEGLVGT